MNKRMLDIALNKCYRHGFFGYANKEWHGHLTPAEILLLAGLGAVFQQGLLKAALERKKAGMTFSTTLSFRCGPALHEILRSVVEKRTLHHKTIKGG